MDNLPLESKNQIAHANRITDANRIADANCFLSILFTDIYSNSELYTGSQNTINIITEIAIEILQSIANHAGSIHLFGARSLTISVSAQYKNGALQQKKVPDSIQIESLFSGTLLSFSRAMLTLAQQSAFPLTKISDIKAIFHNAINKFPFTYTNDYLIIDNLFAASNYLSYPADKIQRAHSTLKLQKSSLKKGSEEYQVLTQLSEITDKPYFRTFICENKIPIDLRQRKEYILSFKKKYTLNILRENLIKTDKFVSGMFSETDGKLLRNIFACDINENKLSKDKFQEDFTNCLIVYQSWVDLARFFFDDSNVSENTGNILCELSKSLVVDVNFLKKTVEILQKRHDILINLRNQFRKLLSIFGRELYLLHLYLPAPEYPKDCDYTRKLKEIFVNPNEFFDPNSKSGLELKNFDKEPVILDIHPLGSKNIHVPTSGDLNKLFFSYVTVYNCQEKLYRAVDKRLKHFHISKEQVVTEKLSKKKESDLSPNWRSSNQSIHEQTTRKSNSPNWRSSNSNLQQKQISSKSNSPNWRSSNQNIQRKQPASASENKEPIDYNSPYDIIKLFNKLISQKEGKG